MAITQFLLQLPTQQTFHWRVTKRNRYSSSSSCIIKPSTKCFIMNRHNKTQLMMDKSFGESSLKLHRGFAMIQPLPGPYAKRKVSDTPDLKKDKVVTDETAIIMIIWRSMENVIKALITTGVLFGLLLVNDHRQALAASGGRMGGRSSRSSSRSYSRSYSSRPSYSSSSGSRYSTQTGSPAPINSEKVEPNFLNIFMFLFVYALIYSIKKWCDGEIDNAKTTSVLKLQVGSLGTGRSLQRELNRIAESADTSTLKGLNYVLQETIVALLRHSNYCISAYSSVDVKRSVKEGEKLFDQLSIEERGKFDEETLVNVNNIRKKTATTHTSNGLINQYIVVTILVAASCVPKLPPIKSNEQLKKALQNLASIPSINIIGVEVLWTPQKEDDSLTEQEMLEDYPLLHPL